MAGRVTLGSGFWRLGKRGAPGSKRGERENGHVAHARQDARIGPFPLGLRPGGMDLIPMMRARARRCLPEDVREKLGNMVSGGAARIA